MMHEYIKLTKIFIIGIILTVITACNLDMSGSSNSSLSQEVINNSEFYLKQIDVSSSNQDKNNFSLLAVRALLSERNTRQASQLLSSITPTTTEQTIEQKILKAYILANNRDDNGAQTVLNTVNLNQIPYNSQKAIYYYVQSIIAKHNKDVINVVRFLINQYTVSSNNKILTDNVQETWNYLINHNVDSNTTIAQNETILNEWFMVTNLYKRGLANPRELKIQLAGWLDAHPKHPLSRYKPKSLSNLIDYQKVDVDKIAVLLPLSGKLATIGNIIKQGFEAANQKSTEIFYYDTVQQNNLDSIKQDIMQRQIGIVVGPLSKPQVTSFLNTDVGNFKTLTLNTPNVKKYNPNVCYFGLSNENEAKAAAKRMWQQGVRKPLVLIMNNDMGLKSAEIFKQQWQVLSNNPTAIKFYDNVDGLKNSLNQEIIDELKQQTADNVTIDAFYVIGKSNEVVFVKNMINSLLNVKNIPVYATSRSNSSNSNVGFRTDMQNVEFSDIPLIHATDTALYKQAIKASSGDLSLFRFYALGYDAFNLAKNLNEVKSINGYQVKGLTGILTTDSYCNIDREVSWFKYNGGHINIVD